MRPKDRPRARELEAKLLKFDANIQPLVGIKDSIARAVLIEQVIESIRRIEFAHFICDHPIEADRADPLKDIFDPVRAAVLHMRSGDYDETFWLIFLFVHFGKNKKDGWRLVRDIYGALGGNTWTWARVSANPNAFRQWLQQNYATLNGGDGISRRFGNHRKYETLDPNSANGTAEVVASYIAWVNPPSTHNQKIQAAHKEVGQNSREVFDYLYRSMKSVRRFGRLAKFDYLTMLGKIGLAPIEPGSAYLSEATGPLEGARLLATGGESENITAAQLEDLLLKLDAHLNVGMQVLEDALCNWQKSPEHFIPFRS